MTTRPPLLPLELRILSLESQVVGINGSETKDGTKTKPEGGMSVIRRIQNINGSLDRLGGQSDALKTLLSGYEGYRSLLTLPTLDPPIGTTGEGSNESSTAVTEADILPDRAKVAILLEAASDLKSADRDLREIELLRDRGVEGSGNLEDIILLKGEVVTAHTTATRQADDLAKARTEVDNLLRRYNLYTETVSELFLELHHRVAAMEDQVSKLERQKRKEMASRY